MLQLKIPNATIEKLQKCLSDPSANLSKEFFPKFKTPKFQHPNSDQFKTLLNVAFAASLLKDESRDTKFKLVWVSPEIAKNSNWTKIEFETERDFSADSLRKLAPLLASNGYLGIYSTADTSIRVWGILQFNLTPNQSIIGVSIESSESGTLSVRISGKDILRLSPNGIIWFGEWTDDLKLFAKIEKAFLSNVDFEKRRQLIVAFQTLCAHVSQQLHGGTILIASAADLSKNISSLQKIQSNSANYISEAIKTLDENAEKKLCMTTAPFDTWNERNAIACFETIAKLSQYDGAIVLNSALELIGFGGIIEMRSEKIQDLEISIFDPTNLSSHKRRVKLTDYPSGTRHKSAISFCSANPDNLAFVSSQDGVGSIFIGTQESRVDAITPLFPRLGFLRERI